MGDGEAEILALKRERNLANWGCLARRQSPPSLFWITRRRALVEVKVSS